jgi:hypothetical protein
MTESELTRKLCAKMEAAGASVLPIIGGRYGRAGWPDRYFAYKGGQVWIEFKVPGGVIDVAQQNVIARLIKHGVRAYIGVHLASGVSIQDVDGNEVALCQTTKDLLLFISQSAAASAPIA